MKNWIQTRWKYVGILAVIAVIALGWWMQRKKAGPEMVTVKPEPRTITEVLKVSGKVDAEEKVRMSFAGASKLTWLGVKEGDWVKKWQGLAAVDARTLQNQLAIAQNNHGKTFRAFENTLDSVDYYSDSGLSETERRAAENAQLDIRNSALAVESAYVAVTLSSMSSPISGVVTRIDQKNVGALMLPSDVIEIVNPASVVFDAVVDEEDISKITASLSATVRLDAFPGTTFPATVKRIAFTPSVSESGGTGYSVWLTLPVDNTLMQYKLGMNGDAEIVLAKEDNVLSIPSDALIERDGVTYVEVLRNGEAVKQQVATGISDDNFVAITSGLTSDDLVIVPSK